MGHFTFTWSHPATEVFVTGTFDDWSKSAQLEKSGAGFSKTVELPPTTEPILYKFVVDGQWTTDHTAASETDSTGNLNNILHPHDINYSDDAAKGQESGSKDIPGGFPATPGLSEEPSFVGINPLPATSGAGNPISVPAGQKLPQTSSFTTNTVNSGVRLDKESYEKSDAGPPVLPDVLNKAERDEINGGSMFTLPPIGGTMIPESSLPMGDANRALPKDNGPFISSVGSDSTTAALAGQAPIEPRGVPTVVSESQHEAHVDPEASSSRQAVQQKSRMEDELQHTIPQAPTTSESGLIGKSEGGISGQVAGVAAAAGSAIAGAAVVAHQKATEALGSDPVKALPASVQNSIEKINGDTTVTQSTSSGVPSMVTDSQRKANVEPEAAANAEAVREKSAMENELHQKVTPAQEPSGFGSDGAAAGVPSVVSKSQNEARVSPEAAANAEAVREKTAMEDELHRKVTPALASTNLGSTNVPAADVPSMVTESQHKADVGPEAAANSEAVAEKSAMEQELKSHVHPSNQSGEPAPTVSAALSSTAPASAPPATPQKPVASAVDTTDSPASSKASKRKSFLGKIKSKLMHK